METKICSTCGKNKDVCEFSRKTKSIDGLMGDCKLCRSYKEKQYRINNTDKVRLRRKTYYENNKDKHNEYFSSRRQLDSEFKLTDNIRRRINHFLKTVNTPKKGSTFDIVGCTPQFLKEHLEMNFKEGMTWENYGLYGWHIDHIIPLSSAQNEGEIYELCHYTNLQPLWAKENLSKGCKILNM